MISDKFDDRGKSGRMYDFDMNTILPVLTMLVLLSASPSEAASPSELRRCSPCELDQLFACGTVGCAPCGKTEGTVLYADGKLPKLKARLQGTVWKGKHFHCDGGFTNRWVGFEAVSACVTVGCSWYDGKPCLVMQYAPNAAVFGGVRDELREIEPGVWLGRGYDGATGKRMNYFLLRSK